MPPDARSFQESIRPWCPAQIRPDNRLHVVLSTPKPKGCVSDENTELVRDYLHPPSTNPLEVTSTPDLNTGTDVGPVSLHPGLASSSFNFLNPAAMAAPPEITCANLSGIFGLNWSLSDDVDTMLSLQGAAYVARQVLYVFKNPISHTYKTYQQDSVTHLDITTLVSMHLDTQENRTLDWQDNYHLDKVFGNCHHKSRLFKTGQFQMQGPGSTEDAAFLRAEKLLDGTTGSGFLDEENVQTCIRNVGDAGLLTEQVWGFETVNGERRHTMRVVTWAGAIPHRCRVVYDYRGQVKERDDDE
ncbi:hypothetical protein LTR46_005758 [Exophiala xenobiotica]|nr:hypothetical protein LTR46_005758 [Exophiala xenobiotica]